MGILSTLFREIVYRPLLNAFAFLYQILPYADVGLAAIILVVIVRLILHRSIVQSVRAQLVMPEIQQRLKEIQKSGKDNREAQARETMALYREYGMHPFSFLTPLLVQIPVFIGIYQVFSKGIALADPSLLYSFLPAITSFNPIAFGIVDFTERSIVMALLAGASQFLQSYLAPKPPRMPATAKDDMGRMMQWQTTYIIPVVFTVIALSVPSAIAFSWTAFNLVAIVQQSWIYRRMAYERRPRESRPGAHEDGDARRD
ncbi:MAG: hypothetical protein A3A44_03080 [Candidatus Sungbacteria bacterium RIFCSPLOWO2_01_FULL_60_25]|uniref:Membrane insertase YidC/Oxa/ALB C-terminal domain-containing protein n=1 Tax=Candidatus Sungbacteria bacterium RIFCSPLOWO2_01_FULL_60_25 TaxID=1802281 RepID=A0A1G2L9X7_9BACT|nr:MAG: hypothetical protein A3A44_03080 [Candidatus Sungbacteria bacterium RIFCSPLOWO2_01_FULL_60_25]